MAPYITCTIYFNGLITNISLYILTYKGTHISWDFSQKSRQNVWECGENLRFGILQYDLSYCQTCLCWVYILSLLRDSLSFTLAWRIWQGPDLSQPYKGLCGWELPYVMSWDGTLNIEQHSLMIQDSRFNNFSGHLGVFVCVCLCVCVCVCVHIF